MNDKTERQQKIQLATQSIETIVEQCGVLALRSAPALTQAINMARGMNQLRTILTESAILSDFMPLQNTALGFLTDKPAGYDWETVREVLIEALLRGFRPINNEYNIIAGRFYGAKNGFDRITHEYPGVQNLQIRLGVPQLVGDKGALVACEARWSLDGKAMSVKCVPAEGDNFDSRIPVKVNSGMGPDAILGKATRKLYARVYQVLTGCSNDIVESDALDLIPVESLPAPALPQDDGRRIKMNGGALREVHDPETGEFPPGNVISE